MAAIDAVIEEVAENLEEAAVATRRISGKGVGIFLAGAAVGLAAGFYLGYRYNREKIRAEAFAESEAEIEKMREVFRESRIVEDPKPSLEEVIEEKGYSAPERPLRPPVPFVRDVPAAPPVSQDVWVYAEELQGRVEGEPYVIHQDEFREADNGYSQVTYTYYAGDDVLCGEDERPLPHADIVVGQNNLKFGHGADDIDVVFVRNDHLEIEMEICRVYTSYEQEVLGLNNDKEN